MKLLHVLAAFWFIGGLLGRDIAFWRARQGRNVHEVSALLQISDFFERWSVTSTSITVLIFGLVITFMGDWPLFGSPQGGAANWLLVSIILSLIIGGAIGALRLVPRRKQREQAFLAALEQNSITPELRAALDDKVVNSFRKIELAVMVIIIALMVMKPF
jgi:uncharacterized membrane protein